MLYWIEYQVQRHRAVTSTSKPNEWLQPRAIKQVPFLRLEDMNFTSAECNMKLCKQQMFQLHSGNKLSQLDSFTQDQPVTVTSDHPVISDKLVQLGKTTTQSGQSADHLDNDLTELFQKCSKSKRVPILFSIECPPYCNSFTESSAHLPLQYQSLFDSEHLKLNYLDLVEAGEKMTGLLDVTEQQCRHLEELTRGQAFSRMWIRYHCGRITASRLYEVVRTDPHKPAVSLVTSLCYPKSEKFSTAATQYGKKYEKQAIAAYKLAATKKHKNLK